MESIFLSAIDMYGHQFCPENLKVRPPPSVPLPEHTLWPGWGIWEMRSLCHQCAHIWFQHTVGNTNALAPCGRGCLRGLQGASGRGPIMQNGQGIASLPQEGPFKKPRCCGVHWKPCTLACTYLMASSFGLPHSTPLDHWQTSSYPLHLWTGNLRCCPPRTVHQCCTLAAFC